MPKLPERSIENLSTRLQIFALCAALFGGCATSAQNVETKAPEAQKDTKPEWINGPEVFEKDGYVYAVGSQKIYSVRGMGIANKGASATAEQRLRIYTNGETVNGENVTTEYTYHTGAGASFVEQYIDGNIMYVLFRTKK